MEKHTPGPWVLHEGGTAVNGSDAALVASCGSLPYRNVWDSRANAQLIAAAPEMEECLEFAENMLRDIPCPNGVNHDDWKALKETITQVRTKAVKS